MAAAFLQGKAQGIQPEGNFVKASHSNIQYVGRVSFRNPDIKQFMAWRAVLSVPLSIKRFMYSKNISESKTFLLSSINVFRRITLEL